MIYPSFIRIHFKHSRDEAKGVVDPLNRRIQPLWWDPFAKGGLGSWTPEYCHLISSRAKLVWFSCTRLGFYAYKVVFDPSSNNGVSKHKVCPTIILF